MALFGIKEFAATGHIDEVRRLAAEGHALDLKDESGKTPLFHAAQNGHAAVIDVLVALGSGAIDEPDDDGWAPVHAAAACGHVNAIEALVRAGTVSLGAQTKTKRQTPIHLATQRGRIPVIELLSRIHYQSINVPDSDECSPLHTAAMNGQSLVVIALLECGSTSFDEVNRYGKTAAHHAIQWCNCNAVERLLRAGCLSFDRPLSGVTPLMCALDYQLRQVTPLLYAVGADTTLLSPSQRAVLAEHTVGIGEREVEEKRFRVYFADSLLDRLLILVRA